MSLWLAPDGKEYPIYGSHCYWINKNLNMLRKMYKEIPEQGEQWTENSVNWLILKGWARVDGLLPTELDLQIADIHNIPQARGARRGRGGGRARVERRGGDAGLGVWRNSRKCSPACWMRSCMS